MIYSVDKMAYLGDCVFELFIRENLIAKNSGTVQQVNVAARELVSANGQARIFNSIREHLRKEEMEVFKKGRNISHLHAPKSAGIRTYRTATGLECLIGYLYLNDKDRLEEIFELILRIQNDQNQ